MIILFADDSIFTLSIRRIQGSPLQKSYWLLHLAFLLLLFIYYFFIILNGGNKKRTSKNDKCNFFSSFLSCSQREITPLFQSGLSPGALAKLAA